MIERYLSFRPFRRVGDKLVVTSYMGWRKIYTANYEGATVKLLPFPEIKKGELIYAMANPSGKYKFWHPTKFEPLFWPVNGIIRHIGYGKNSNSVYEAGVVVSGSSIVGEMKENEVYSMFDCDGCPSFSHKTVVYISENYPGKMDLFEPLTADIVYKYFEIMRDTLDKVKWKINILK
jgi:hypothetical protein